MSIYLTLGTYTNEGAAGLVGAEHVDRRAAMDSMCNSVGAKLVDYHITRGAYDFCVIAEADSFAKITALTLRARATGTVDNLITLESVNVEKIRGVSKRVQYTPPSGS